MDLVLVETTGTGQSEVEVIGLADTTVVVTVAGLGDDVQTLKAGLLEIGDIFVVNKSDQSGAEHTMRELRQMVRLAPKRHWIPPVLAAQAQSGEWTLTVAEAIVRHYEAQRGESEQKSRHLKGAEWLLRDALIELMVESTISKERASGRWDSMVGAEAARRTDPISAAHSLASRWYRAAGADPAVGSERGS